MILEDVRCERTTTISSVDGDDISGWNVILNVVHRYHRQSLHASTPRLESTPHTYQPKTNGWQSLRIAFSCQDAG